MNRRDFLKYCLASGLSFPAMPVALASESFSNKTMGTLILIEFQGGNDGLNMVVPYQDDRYYDLRPTLGMKANEIITLNKELALHYALEPMMPLWEAKQVALFLGLGYAKPNHSHFRSIEIWETASKSHQYLEEGWVARALQKMQAEVANGLVLGGEFGPLSGLAKTLEIKNIQSFLRQGERLKPSVDQKVNNPALEKLLVTQSIILDAANHIKTHLKPLQAPVAFAKNSFAQQMALATQIIQSGLNIPAIKVNLHSFDTHANQRPTQARLLAQFAQAVAASQKALQTTGHWDDTVMMTYSEFGRRAKENGAKGTDHGTAAPHFVIGGKVSGGLYGQQPSLENLVKNDLVFTTEFKQMYQFATRQAGLKTHRF